MATREEIDDLIRSWLQSPTWDLADSAGFAEHRDELVAFQAQVWAAFEKQRPAASTAAATDPAVAGWLKEIVRELMDVNRNMHEIAVQVREIANQSREIKDVLRRR